MLLREELPTPPTLVIKDPLVDGDVSIAMDVVEEYVSETKFATRFKCILNDYDAIM